jgi:hypothetical protein
VLDPKCPQGGEAAERSSAGEGLRSFGHSGERRSASASGRLQRVRDLSRPPDIVMETLKGFPNLPALWLRQAKPGYAYA